MGGVPAFQPTASLEALYRRSQLLKCLREFFDHEGFWEVQTPVLASETVVDAHIDPIEVSRDSIGLASADETSVTWYLQTSPELLMKRLLASGARAIYQIGPVFRAGEAGSRHNPEFTMVEWYRCEDDLAEGVALLGALAQKVLNSEAPRVVTYQEIYLQVLSLDPLAADLSELQKACALLAGTPPQGLDRDGHLEWLFTEAIQPTFVGQTPVIITHYPESQAALAQRSATHPGTADRFELFYEGVELANGYAELRDADELERRIVRQNQLRVLRGAKALPAPQKLLAAMRAGLPRCSGCALGLERLLMVKNSEQDIESVLPFPAARV